jgi:hypothetical protein
MKQIFILAFVAFTLHACAQKQSFDLASFIAPKGWKKQVTANGIQFSKEEAAKGTYGSITLLKAAPGTPDSKENFEMAWTSLIKEMVTVSGEPEMQAPVTENGWEVISGHSTFEQDGNKGIVILATSTGFGKMMNLIILTNTDVYEKAITAFTESISLKKPAGQQQTVQQQPVQQPKKAPAIAVSNGYTFTTTNFDDGWTGTAQENWVLVTKSTIRVLIHYPDKAVDRYSMDLLEGLKNAWNVLVAPKYSNMSAVNFKPLHNWESIEFAEADAVEIATGKPVHIVLYKKNFSGGAGKYLEFITPDKKSFVQEFGVFEAGLSWEKVEKMSNYNKFAVAAADLKGKWTNNYSGFTQYVNAYTGADAGANTHASNENYHLGPGNAYKWDLGVASGMVGNIKFQSAKSAGKFSMIGNWQIHFTDIEGKPRTYNVSFSCIKGFRILWIDGQAFAKVE